MPSAKLMTIPDAKPKISATLAGLGSGQYDGHVGIVRIGSGVDAFVEEFLWDSSARAGAGGWIGKGEHVVMDCVDAWALDWTRQPISSVRGAWIRPNGGVGWARSGAAAILKNDVTIPSDGSTFHFDIYDYSANTLPPSGNLTARGNTYIYTGVSGAAGSKQITGVTLQFGTPGVTHKGGSDPGDYRTGVTPIIPYAPTLGGGGDPGGWGTNVRIMDRVGEMWAAGFRLQERIHAWMNGSQDFKSLTIAPFYLNYNLDEDFLYPTLGSPPIAGMLGPGQSIIGPNTPMAGIGGGSIQSVVDERQFDHRQGNWVAWTPAGAPTKRFLVPVLYGKMPVDADDTGQSYGVTLALRWVQP